MTVTILDGGMGRELARIGAPFRQPEWSALAMIEAPELVGQVHESYVAAGAQVITTNAYALVPFHIGDRFAAHGGRLAGLAGRLARDVANRHAGVGVAGCLPPVLGSYRPEVFDAAEARPIVDVLVGAQAEFVDVWLAETTSSIAEARLTAEVLSGTTPETPLWISYTLDEQLGAPPRLRSGEPVADAVIAAEALGAVLVAFNCSRPEVMTQAVVAARQATELPIGVYANAFVEHDDEAANENLHGMRDDVTPERYLRWAAEWVEAGATLVGGCCGIGPEHVSALSAHLSCK